LLSRQQQKTTGNSFFLSFVLLLVDSSVMDTKEAIDSKLTALGKDRQWLATATGYSYFSVRDSLAPQGRPLSARMEKAFVEAIGREEQARAVVVELPERITLEVSSEEYDAFNRASLEKMQTVKEWALHELNRAAAAHHKGKAVLYETHEQWQAKNPSLAVAEEPDEGKFYRSGLA
jgi:hypothetical protein